MTGLSVAQHEARAQGIGGSDAGAACGISRWKTPVQLWQEKTGQVEPENLDDKEFVQWGSLLEDVIADEWSRRHGRKVRRVNTTRVDKELPFMLGNIDRDIVGIREGLECKNSSAWMADEWGEDGTDEVPLFYLIQGAHYMRVFDYEAWNFAVLLGGNELRSYRILRDEEVESGMIELESYFWECVTDNKPPEAIEYDDLARINPQSEGYIEATDYIAQRVSLLGRVKARSKRLEKIENRLKIQVGKYMGAAGDLVLPGDVTTPIATFRTGKRSKFLKTDLAKVEDLSELPETSGKELVEAFTERGTGRTFLVK